ncbi:MAG: phosphoglucosamine mutase, partial [Clostridiales bacterium]|nr:phosphoglucosamine mutase [Clostridiales bacterium]
RCLCVDEKGNLISGDHILYICACYMKDRGMLDHNTVVTTVMSNFGLYKALDRAGISYEKTDVGDKYVYECMRANGHLIGGEQSGHIIFSKYAATGDGLLTAIKLMQAMLSQKQPLSELAAPVTIYPQLMKNVRVTDKAAAISHPLVKASVIEAEDLLGSNGRVLLRKSGTEPLIRVMAEAPTSTECHQAVDIIVDAINESGLTV